MYTTSSAARRSRLSTAFGLLLMGSLALLPISSAHAAFTRLNLQVNGKHVALPSPALYDGREVYLPLDTVRALGGSYRLTDHEESALVTFPGGQTDEVALARPNGRPMLPGSAIARALRMQATVNGGICAIDHTTRSGRRGAVMAAYGPPVPARVAPAPVPARTPRPLPVAVRPAAPRAAERPVIHTVTAAVSTMSAGSMQRAESPDAPSAMPETPRPRAAVRIASLDIPVLPAGNSAPAARDTALVMQLPRIGTPDELSASPRMGGHGPVTIRNVVFEAQDSSHATVRINTDGKAAGTARLLDSGKLVIDVANSTVNTEGTDWTVNHPFLTNMHVEPLERTGGSRITLDMSKLALYRLVSTPDGLALNLNLPRGVGRPMNELVVVVDPGHGGSSTGCHANSGGGIIYEKSVTLSIGQKVRDALQAAGVKVLMTRTTDTFVDLPARPGLATTNNADLFVSIHVDDCGIPNSASGSTAYYHGTDSSSRALAQSLIGSISRVSGLPSRGALSDGVLYQSGLSVLRNATVPAVLVEVGYFNNARDKARILSESFQQNVAQAICDGIRGYIEARLPTADAPAPDDTDTVAHASP